MILNFKEFLNESAKTELQPYFTQLKKEHPKSQYVDEFINMINSLVSGKLIF